MVKTRLKKAMSVLIAILMVIGMIPANFVFAAGNKVLAIEPANSGKNVRFDFPAATGAADGYIASFRVRGNGSVNFKLMEDWNGNTAITQKIEATEDWQTVKVEYPRDYDGWLEFCFYDNVASGGTIYIDDAFFGIEGGENLISNGDFEQGNTGINNDGNIIYSVIEEPAEGGEVTPPAGESSDVRTGSKALKAELTGGPNGNWAYYAYKAGGLEQNTDYTIRLWMKGTGAFAIKATNTNWDKIGDALVAKLNGVEEWTEYTLTFNSGSNTEINVQLQDNQGDFVSDNPVAGTIYIDDITLAKKDGGENLLENGGFENGAEGWVEEKNTNPVVFSVIEGKGQEPVDPNPQPPEGEDNGLFVHNGQYSIKLTTSGSGSWPYAVQWLTVQADTDYTVEFWVKGSGSFSTKITKDWNPVKTEKVTATDTWTKVSFTWNSGSQTNCGFFFYDDSGVKGSELYIDEVFFGVSGGENLIKNGDLEAGSLNGWQGDQKGAFTLYKDGSAPPVLSNPEGLANLGVYVWDRNPEGVRDFGEWIGSEPYLAEDFFTYGNWDEVCGQGRIEAWRDSEYQYRMIWSLPPFPSGDGYSLEAAANGDYNEYYKKAAQNLIDAGMEDAIIRYGHEFNGNWYIWTAANGKEEAYAKAFQQCVEAMRSVEGGSFEFCWNPTVNQWGIDLAKCYPGDEYVDIIGIDVYDQSWGNFSEGGRIYSDAYLTADEDEKLKRREEAWQSILRGNWGLQDIDDFADQHNKPVGICEWGIVDRGNASDGGGGNDNPYFIEQMWNWINTNNVAWHVYFNVSAGDGDHDLYDTVKFPESAAKFQELWNPEGEASTLPSVDPSDVENLPGKYIKVEAEDGYYAGSNAIVHGDPWASGNAFVAMYKSLNCLEYTNVNASDGLTIVYQGWQSDLHASVYVNDIKVKERVLFENHGRGWKDAYSYVTLSDLQIPQGANLKIQIDKTDEDDNWDSLKIDYILLHNAEGTYENSGEPTGPVGGVTPPVDPSEFPVHTGTHSLQLKQSGNSDWPYYISNTWPGPIEANTDYQIRLWVKGSGSATVKLINGDWTPLVSQKITGTDEWQEIVIDWNSGSFTQWAGWAIYDDSQEAGGTLYIDDIYFGKTGGTNLIPNEGFENGSSGWDPEGKGQGFFKVVEGTPDTEIPDEPEVGDSVPYRTSFTHSGVYGLVGAITGDGSTGGPSLNAKPALKAGETYVYSAYVKGSGRMALVIQKAFGDWAEVLVQPADATGEWQKVVAVFTPQEDGQYNIKVGMRDESGNAGTVYVDDVLLTNQDGSEVIVDSDFENGGSDWWIGEGFTCVDHSVSTAEGSHSGSWIMQVSPSAETNGNAVRLNPDVSLEAGKTYHFSIWAKGHANFAVQMQETTTWSQQCFENLSVDSDEWTEITFDYTAPITSGYMFKLLNYSSEGVLYLDDLLLYTEGGNNLIPNCDFEQGDVNWDDKQAGFAIVNLAKVELDTGFVDELDDLDRIADSSNIELDSSSTGVYGGDTSRVARQGGGDGYIVYQLEEETLQSLSIYAYNDEEANASDIRAYVSSDGLVYQELNLSKDIYANPVKKTMPLAVYEAYGILDGMKYLKIVLPDHETLKANEISKVVVNANTMPVTATPGSGNIEKGTKVTLATGEADAVIRYAIEGQNGTFTYTEPIQLDGSANITAWAEKDGKLDSIKRTFAYLDESEIIVDQYGQIKSAEFTGKIHNDEEFAQAAEEDQAWWDSISGPDGRDIYGGLEGSRETYGFTETGYFHIEKLGDKSVMIDPLGNLYFNQSANGTGYVDETYTQVTGREQVYDWLPEKDDPTYAAAWKGADNFSFYVANLIRQNGSFSQEEYTELSDERVKKLGFTAAGAWSNTASLPTYEWLPMPSLKINGTELFDIFHPDMEAQMAENFKALQANQNNPNLLGYLFANELPYASLKSAVPAANGESCGSKAKLIELLQEKYTTIEAFNEAWDASMASWDQALTSGLSVKTEASVQDMDEFTQVYLDKLYSTIAKYAKENDPNHMVLGDRWLGTVMNDSKLRGYLCEAAGKYMDALSYNYYTYDLNMDMIAEMYEQSGGTPFIFTEFHYGDPTTGLTFASRMAEDEHEKGLMYRNYVEKAAASGMVVGTNWFVYLDQAPTGRYFQGLNGEAGAIGMLNVADRPYRDFLDSVMTANYNIYDLILGIDEPYQYEFKPGQGDREDDKVLEVPKAKAPITIGAFEDWEVEASLLTDRDLVLGIMKQGVQGEMKVLWDEEYYYIQAHISDPTPLQNKEAVPGGAHDWIWNGDGLELFFGPNDVEEGGAMKLGDNQVLLAAAMDGEGNITTASYWNNPFDTSVQPDIDMAAKLDDDGQGYMIEARIKFSDIGVTDVGNGTLVRYDMGFDEGTVSGRERQFFWNGVDGNSSNREKWGMMKLVDTVTPPVDPDQPGTGDGGHTYEPPTHYYVNVTVGSHGSVTPGSGYYAIGEKQSFTITPDAGYVIDRVLVDGRETAVTGGVLTLYMDEPYRITVTFKEGGVSVPGIDVGESTGNSTATGNPQTGDSAAGSLMALALLGGAVLVLAARKK